LLCSLTHVSEGHGTKQEHSRACRAHTGEPPSRAVGQACATPTCELFARKTEPSLGRRHVYLYEVLLDGDLVITGSPDPEPDLARVLRSRGMTGKVTLFDGIAGKPRTIID
jgi:hypothetical protein